MTAIQVEELGLPLRLKEGTQSAKIGVRKMSKPAMKPTLDADEVAMPLHYMFKIYTRERHSYEEKTFNNKWRVIL